MKPSLLAIVLTTSMALTSVAAGDIIGFENFDGGAINLNSTANVADYNAGGGAGGNVRVVMCLAGWPALWTEGPADRSMSATTVRLETVTGARLFLAIHLVSPDATRPAFLP